MSIEPSIKNSVFTGGTQLVDYVPKGECRIVKPNRLTAASDGEHDVLKLRYRSKSREVHRSMLREKRKFAIVLVREVEDDAERNDFRSVHRIAKELACGGKCFDDHVKDVVVFSSEITSN